jgi:hypothetical protein
VRRSRGRLTRPRAGRLVAHSHCLDEQIQTLSDVTEDQLVPDAEEREFEPGVAARARNL